MALKDEKAVVSDEEMDEEVEDESEDSMEAEGEEEEEGGGDDGKTYVPNMSGVDTGEQLEYDESAYVMYHKAESGFPCLSFDVIVDHLGDSRADDYPQTCYLVAGTQATKVHLNKLMVLKMSNLRKIQQKEEKEDDESSDSDEEELDNRPDLDCAQIQHQGCVNRVRTTVINNKAIAASWSELGRVNVWDLTRQLQAVDDGEAMTQYMKNKDKIEPIFTFVGHRTEGYGIDWSKVTPGVLASGDCEKNIFVWKPTEYGQWHVDQHPLTGHTDSVEDIQWSPNEANVLASCSVDKSIRIWDIRSRPGNNCMVTVNNAHESDVNVISWNRIDKHFLLSGGDDGAIKTWDMRQFKGSNPKPLAVFKHHVDYITSLEWHPTDSTVFAASGNDNQVTLWDLAVERDQEQANEDEAVAKLPPQLLFIHQGQKEVKELHFHQQMPGVVISTSLTGFDIFRTISV